MKNTIYRLSRLVSLFCLLALLESFALRCFYPEYENSSGHTSGSIFDDGNTCMPLNDMDNADDDDVICRLVD